jgi:predicted ATPase
VIRRLYVHNFRCLENFELPVSGLSSVLLIGKNGSGKTTVGVALEILQKIARGTNRVGDLVKPKDLARGRTDVPMRFEIEVELEGRIYRYSLALESPKGFGELRVLEEELEVGGNAVYSRGVSQWQLGEDAVTLVDPLRVAADANQVGVKGSFGIDWHLVALPIIQKQNYNDPLFIFREWLARMLILRPVPSLIHGDSEQPTLVPNPAVTDLGAWFLGLFNHAPSAYAEMDKYLKQIMPDLIDIKNPKVGRDYQSLEVQFSNDQGSLKLPFGDLSDGEKCFMICALVLAAKHIYGPLLCFWDEPDNYLAPSEVGHFVLALRKAFQSGGQFIATSHNPEAIRRFSDENTLVLYRNSHLEPTMVRPLSEIHVNGDLVSALLRGDLEP